MAPFQNLTGKNLARGAVYCQLFLVGCCVLVFALFSGKVAAISAFLGGAVCLLSTIVFVWQHFRITGAGQAGAMLTNFFKAGLLKWSVAAIAISAVFKWPELKPEAAIVTFIIAYMAYCITPLVLKRNH